MSGFFFFKQKTAYEMRISDWSSDVCSSDLFAALARATGMALQVDSYHVSSVTHGEDAQGQASVTARVDGSELTGSGTSTDILEASALAWLEVANRVTRPRHPPRRAAPARSRHDAQDPYRQAGGCHNH